MSPIQNMKWQPKIIIELGVLQLLIAAAVEYSLKEKGLKGAGT